MNDFLRPLVVTLFPEERLCHSVVGRLSASLAFIVPSEWANWEALINSHSSELNSANLGENISSLFAVSMLGGAVLQTLVLLS